MVKKWIIMLSLTAILIIGGILEYNYVNNSFKNLIDDVQELQIEITNHKEKIDTEELINSAYSIHEKWHKRVKILKSVIWHTGIKDIEVGLARIAVYIEENDYTEANAELCSLIDFLEHYSEDFTITLENIF